MTVMLPTTGERFSGVGLAAQQRNKDGVAVVHLVSESDLGAWHIPRSHESQLGTLLLRVLTDSNILE